MCEEISVPQNFVALAFHCFMRNVEVAEMKAIRVLWFFLVFFFFFLLRRKNRVHLLIAISRYPPSAGCTPGVLDMAKAFDRVDHALLSHMLSTLGVNGIELHWFESYLHEQSVDLHRC